MGEIMPATPADHVCGVELRHRPLEMAFPGQLPATFRLDATIQRDIVDRLFVPAPRYFPTSSAEDPFDGPHVTRFVELIRLDDADAALTVLGDLRIQGQTIGSIYLGILAPAARQLGELWEQDLCTFSDVTLGLWQLHRIIREFSPAFCSEGRTRVSRRPAHIYLTPLPGAQHTFGILLVAEFFRNAGWAVTSGPVARERDICAALGGQYYDVVGLSLNCDSDLDDIGACIRTLRRRSRNKTIGVMVGGSCFEREQDLLARIGADVFATNAKDAVWMAENFRRSGKWYPSPMITGLR